MTALNILGMVLTLAACSALGFYFSNRDTYRLQDLLAFKKALLILKSEIEYAGTPLPEAMAQIAARIAPTVSALFADYAQCLTKNEGETAYRLWLAAIENHKSSLYLIEEDWEIFSAFGKTLGYLDKQMQGDSIRLAVDYIDAKVKQLQAETGKTRRMYRSLGVLGGLLLIVVLW